MVMFTRDTATRAGVLTCALVLGLSATAGAQGRGVEGQKRREQIQIMEGVLARAVGLGAEEVGRQMQLLDPTMTVLTGRARARGFVLEGYGVFFDVEIPAIRQSVVWSMMTVQRDMQIGSALEGLRRALDALPEEPARQRVQQEFQRVQRLVMPVQQARSAAAPPPGEVAAAAAPAPVGQTADIRQIPDVRQIPPTALLDDPTAHYTDAVKRKLVDAMLEYSLPMDIGADEWLTVAARDSEGPLTPGEIYDAVTIVLRVKGSDLAIYAADRSRRDEIRSKVLVSVF